MLKLIEELHFTPYPLFTQCCLWDLRRDRIGKTALTYYKAWVYYPVGRVFSIVAQVSDLHVAIVDAENKCQSEGGKRCWFTSSY